jgi:CRISPR-associated endonuclease/helicase Cas3
MPGALEHLSKLLGIERDTALPTFTWLAGLHDAGKFSESFQGLHPAIHIELAERSLGFGYHVRHDALGRTLLDEYLLASRPMTDWLALGDRISSSRAASGLLAPLIEAIACHHGKPAVHPNRDDARSHFTDEDLDAFTAFAADFNEILGVAPRWTAARATLKTKFKLGSWSLAGWMVLADWLGSNQDFFPYEQEVVALVEYWERAQQLAVAAVSESGVISPTIRKFDGLQTLFPKFDAASPLQDYAEHVVLDDGPQLFVLEDATGAGKTEAALILASRMMSRGLGNGVYIGLPTTATANGMYERMQVAYEQFFDSNTPASLMLAHSSRDISDKFQASLRMAPDRADVNETYDRRSEDATASATCAGWLSDTRKKALLAPFGVGTIDQALLAGLAAKHQSLRLVGLSQKILIVDEVHAFDAYMNGLLRNLLRFHAAQGGSAILLSATVPQQLREQLCDAFSSGRNQGPVELTANAFPLATQCATQTHETDISAYAKAASSDGRVIRPQKSHDVAVTLQPDRDECVAHLLAAVERGECACWIRNTVGEAVDAYELLGSMVPADKLTLFHARFTLADRQRIEKHVLDRFGKDSEPDARAGQVVVATQVIEQSLDLDFDCMVTDLAPIDLILQRAGRMYRHDRGRTREPLLVVHGPFPDDEVDENWYADCFDGAQWVYRDHGKLWLSARALQNFGRVRIPEQARDLVEFVYGPEAEMLIPEALEEANWEAFAEELEHENMADFNSLDFDRGYGDGSSGRWFEDTRTPTRLGDPSVTLRLGRLNADEQITPWADAANHPWRLSEVSVRASKVAELDPDATPAAAVLDAARASMPDKGKWNQLVPLTPPSDEGGRWTCRIIDGRDTTRLLTYSSKLGLLIQSEDS